MNNTLKKFAADCVKYYAEFNEIDVCYHLEVGDLPDFVQNEFASHLIENELAYANEANGVDNPAWEKTMKPALIRYMANSTNKDEAIEFNYVWRKGITSYLAPIMQELIDNALYEFNSDYGYIRSANYHNGVPWGYLNF